MKILLLEDDIALQNSIKSFLVSKDFDVSAFHNGEDALEALEKTSYDLYLLDINVPGIDGLQLLELIHNFDKSSKILILSASNDIETIERAYNHGAIDYLKKPFYLQELYFKIELFTKNSQEKKPKTTTLLTKKEHRLLQLLAQNKENVTTYEEIAQQVYQESDMTPDALRGLIKRLRKKLIDYNIKSISGIGYLLEKNE